MELTVKEQEIINNAEREYKQSVKKRTSEYILFIKKGKQNKHVK